MSLSLHYGSHRAAPIAWVCGWAEVSLSSCVSSPTLVAVQRSERHIDRSLNWGRGVWFMRLPRFYTGRRINVFPMLLFCCQDSQGFGSLLFPFHLVADENTLFMRLKIDFLKFQQFYQLRGIYSTDFLVKLTKFHFECTRQICTL